MSGSWNELSISDIRAQAAAKARAVDTNFSTGSPPDNGAGLLHGKRNSSSVAFLEKPSTRQRTSEPPARSNGASPITTPEPPATSGDVSEVPSKPLSAASSSVAAAAPEYDPVESGTVPCNLIFGHYGTIGTDYLMALKQKGLMDLSVTLGIFPDVDSIPSKLSVPSLRNLIASITGSVKKWTFDDHNKVFTFPDGVTVERPLFREPTAA